jgi:hypothetical protein
MTHGINEGPTVFCPICEQITEYIPFDNSIPPQVSQIVNKPDWQGLAAAIDFQYQNYDELIQFLKSCVGKMQIQIHEKDLLIEKQRGIINTLSEQMKRQEAATRPGSASQRNMNLTPIRRPLLNPGGSSVSSTNKQFVLRPSTQQDTVTSRHFDKNSKRPRFMNKRGSTANEKNFLNTPSTTASESHYATAKRPIPDDIYAQLSKSSHRLTLDGPTRKFIQNDPAQIHKPAPTYPRTISSSSSRPSTRRGQKSFIPDSMKVSTTLARKI